MKIVVIGGTDVIGSKTVAILRQRGHEVAASPTSGVNTITGEGLEHKAVLEFFQTSGRNLLAAEAAAASVTMWPSPSSKPTGTPRSAITAPRSRRRN